MPSTPSLPPEILTPRLVLRRQQGEAHAWCHLRHRARAPQGAAARHPLLQHGPTAFEPPRPLASCLRTPRGV